jgi:hypothetical protein
MLRLKVTMFRLIALLILLAVPATGDTQEVCYALQCGALLYYRPITAMHGVLSHFNHAFWSTGYEYGSVQNFLVAVEDGGPQYEGCPGGNCGYLQAWYTPGTLGHEQPGDNTNTATLWWGTGFSYQSCAAVDAITAYTQGFPNNLIPYNFVSANSNSFAHWAATFAGLTPPQPPNTQGW